MSTPSTPHCVHCRVRAAGGDDLTPVVAGQLDLIIEARKSPDSRLFIAELRYLALMLCAALDNGYRLVQPGTGDDA